MKPHRLAVAILIASLTGLNLQAQIKSERLFRFDDGTRVLYQVQTDVSEIDSGLNQSYNNTIERTLLDQGKAWLGFEIHINRIAHGDTFQVSMEPISGWPFFAEPPAAREVHSGDRVMLDVMEQPSTGKKIFDTFQVGLSGTPMQAMPAGTRAIAQIPQHDMTIQLNSPTFKVHDEPMAFYSSNRAAGAKVAVTVPGLGRFLFTSHAEPGFHMEAVAEGRALDFIAGANRYRLDCEAPILNASGAWYLWVRFEPSASPAPGKDTSFRSRQLTVEVVEKKSDGQ